MHINVGVARLYLRVVSLLYLRVVSLPCCTSTVVSLPCCTSTGVSLLHLGRGRVSLLHLGGGRVSLVYIPPVYLGVPHSGIYCPVHHPGYTLLPTPRCHPCPHHRTRCLATTLWALFLSASLGEARMASLLQLSCHHSDSLESLSFPPQLINIG